MAEEKSWTQKILRFSFVHAAFIGVGLWALPGIVEAAHLGATAKVAAMKTSLATYAASTPIVPVGPLEALTKSAAGMLANFSFGGHAVAGTGAFVAPAPAL